MATRSDTFTMNPISLFALIGAIVAFVLTGAIVDVIWVAIGAAVGGAIGWGVRQWGKRARTFAEVVDVSDSTSKQELYAEAQELGIEGRSSMGKDELAQAIAEKRS